MRHDSDFLHTASLPRHEALRLLSAAIDFAKHACNRPDLPNPVERIGLLPPQGSLRWLTRNEAARLLKAASRHARHPHLPAFIRLALHTGCRASELLGLEWSRVDWEQARLRVEAAGSDAARRRHVPLDAEALGALREMRAWCDAFAALSPRVFATAEGSATTLQRGFSVACRRARVADCRIQDLRHTCASWLVMAGTPLQVVKERLGYSSPTAMQRYAHLLPEQVRHAMKQLGGSAWPDTGSKERER